MELRLKVLEGKHAGQEIKVAGPKFLIGRGEDCQLRPSSDSVSRQHCIVQIENGRATICDLNSRNGTLINGERIEGRYPLKTGDRISIGHLHFEAVLTTDLKAQKQPVVKSVKEAATRTQAAGSEEDIDVDAWLHSADAIAPSRELSTSETQKLSFSDTSPDLDAAMLQGRTKASDEKKSDIGKRSGKLPTSTAADGGAAAAEILRKLSKYR